jgi:hypothetical protein
MLQQQHTMLIAYVPQRTRATGSHTIVRYVRWQTDGEGALSITIASQSFNKRNES